MDDLLDTSQHSNAAHANTASAATRRTSDSHQSMNQGLMPSPIWCPHSRWSANVRQTLQIKVTTASYNHKTTTWPTHTRRQETYWREYIVHLCKDNQRLTYNESLSNTVTVIYFYHVTSSWKFLHKLRQFPWTQMKSRLDLKSDSSRVWCNFTNRWPHHQHCAEQAPCEHTASASASQHEKMRRQRKHILTKHWTYLYPETMYISLT